MDAKAYWTLARELENRGDRRGTTDALYRCLWRARSEGRLGLSRAACGAWERVKDGGRI